MLAAIHAVSGDPVRGGQVRGILAVASALVPVLVYRILMRHGAGRSAAIAAGLLCALSFGLDVIGGAATTEGIYLLLGLGLLWFTGRGIARTRDALVAGAGVGLLGLIRAEGILFGALAAAAGIAWPWTGAAHQRAGRTGLPALARATAPRAAAVLAGLVIVLSPWTIRNAVRLREWNQTTGAALGTRLPTFVPITAYGPLNFALANNDLATGGFQRSLLSSGKDQAVLQLGDPQHRHYFLAGTREGLRWITTRPSRFAALVTRKLDIATRAFDLGWTPWNIPSGRTGLRRPVDMFSPDMSWLRWLTIALAAAGAWILCRRPGGGRLAVLLAIPLLSLLVSTVLFFGYVRQGALAIPSVFAFAAVAIAEGLARVPEGMRRALSSRRATWGWIALVLAIEGAAALQDRNYEASGSADTPGGKLLRDAPMRITPAR